MVGALSLILLNLLLGMICQILRQLTKQSEAELGVSILREKKCKDISEGEELEENKLEIDLDFSTKMKSQAWKDAFVHVILDAYKDMKQNGDETPDDVSNAFNDWSKGYSLDEGFDHAISLAVGVFFYWRLSMSAIRFCVII